MAQLYKKADFSRKGPFLFKDKGSPAEYGAGMKLCIERGWLVLHESGTFVRFTPAGAELFAEEDGLILAEPRPSRSRVSAMPQQRSATSVDDGYHARPVPVFRRASFCTRLR
jgi:hypothetical protein